MSLLMTTEQPADLAAEQDLRRGRAKEIAPNVFCLPLSIVNAYFVRLPSDSWVLVDAGIYGSGRVILRESRKLFGTKPPEAIVLTHGHFDHVGALKQLAEYWNVPIYAHHLEFPYLDGRSSYPPPDPTVGRGAMSLMSWMYPTRATKVGERLLEFPSDGTVPHLVGWRWLPTPGHTPGHISLWRQSDRTLIVGDAFVTTRQESMTFALIRKAEINGPPAYFTCNWIFARRSVEKLAALEPEIAATGHGKPMHGHVLRSKLHMLAARFDEVAKPADGRYSNEPAICNEDGIVYLPPRTALEKGSGYAGLALLLIAAGTLGGIAVSRAVRKSRYIKEFPY